MTASAAEVCVIGGSSAFFPALARVLWDRAAELPSLRFRLFGRNQERLQIIAGFCNEAASHLDVDHRYLPTTSLEEAVEGAGIVLNQARFGGFEGRSHDETFPLAFGYPGDETIGPGGLAALLRSLPRTLQIAQVVERLAPYAWFLNLSNPMSMLTHGLLRRTRLRVFGLCELPIHTIEKACQLVGVNGEVRTDYLGVNHQGWFLRLEIDGRDRLPDIIDRISALDADHWFRVDGSVMAELGALPLRYMRLYYHTQREVEKAASKTTDRGFELARLSRDLYRKYRTCQRAVLPRALAARDTAWNELTVAPALVALLGGAEAELYVTEANNGHLPFLANETTIEKRAIVSASGPHSPLDGARRARETHPDLVRLLESICRFEQLAVRAALSRERDDILGALASHPFQIPRATAQEMLPALLQPVEVTPDDWSHP